MESTITVVLPVHNQERTLSSLVWNVLEVADSIEKNVRILLVDDGSTDDTYDVACELSRTVPQIEVIRQAAREGLKAALDRVRRDTNLKSAIVHDGASPIDLQELAGLLAESSVDSPVATADALASTTGDGRGSRRFASVSALNARMQLAHRTITSFRWMNVDEDRSPRRMSQGKRPLTPASSRAPTERPPMVDPKETAN